MKKDQIEKEDLVDARFNSIHGTVTELIKQLDILNIKDILIAAQLRQILHDSNQEEWDESNNVRK